MRNCLAHSTEEGSATIDLSISNAIAAVIKDTAWTDGILCTRNVSFATACNLICTNSTFYIFDPHRRNEYGIPVPDGIFSFITFH